MEAIAARPGLTDIQEISTRDRYKLEMSLETYLKVAKAGVVAKWSACTLNATMSFINNWAGINFFWVKRNQKGSQHWML